MNFERVKKVKQSKPFTVIDVAVVATLIALTVLCALVIFRKDGKTVVISSPSGTVTRPLSVDADIELQHLIVHIKGGKVYVTHADCADKICEKTGAISRAGQSIVCLPNAVTVTVTGKTDLSWEVG